MTIKEHLQDYVIGYLTAVLIAGAAVGVIIEKKIANYFNYPVEIRLYEQLFDSTSRYYLDDNNTPDVVLEQRSGRRYPYALLH